jgi:hypothetical protein
MWVLQLFWILILKWLRYSEHIVQLFFNTRVFLMYVLGSTPNHIPLKWRCINYSYDGFRHIHLKDMNQRMITLFHFGPSLGMQVAQVPQQVHMWPRLTCYSFGLSFEIGVFTFTAIFQKHLSFSSFISSQYGFEIFFWNHLYLKWKFVAIENTKCN